MKRDTTGHRTSILRKISEVIRTHSSFVTTCHIRPEGDAIGSMLAITHALREMGKVCDPVSTDGVPKYCQFLPGSEWVRKRAKRKDYEVAIVLDTDGEHRIALPKSILNRVKVLINIDHHTGNNAFGNINWVDATAAATGEMVYKLLQYIDVPISREIATCLYAAIATDTGTFRFDNTTSQSLRIAAELVKAGAKPWEAAHHIFESRPANVLQLWGYALTRIRVDESAGVAWTSLKREHFNSTDTTDEDTEGLINLLRGIPNVHVIILFRELRDELIKVSLRASGDVNVARIAAQFGGGGHVKAAGCSLPPPLEEAIEHVLNIVRREIERTLHG